MGWLQVTRIIFWAIVVVSARAVGDCCEKIESRAAKLCDKAFVSQ